MILAEGGDRASEAKSRVNLIVTLGDGGHLLFVHIERPLQTSIKKRNCVALLLSHRGQRNWISSTAGRPAGLESAHNLETMEPLAKQLKS